MGRIMSSQSQQRNRKGYVAALVVGTALSTFGPASAGAVEPRAINDMVRYCNTCWRNARVQPDAWDDCTQEVLRRMLERVETGQWSKVLCRETQERREFLRAIDTVKKSTQRVRRPAPLLGEVGDPAQQARQHREDLRQHVLQAARGRLTARQFEIVRLSLDGWSVAEIGDKLAISPVRVSDEKYKAVRRLRQLLA